MAQSEILRRYIEAGMAFTEATRARAEEFVKDLARTGEVQWDQVQSQVDELMDWSKRNSDEVRGVVRDEVGAPLSQLGQALGASFKEGLAAMATWRRTNKGEPPDDEADGVEEYPEGITAEGASTEGLTAEGFPSPPVLADDVVAAAPPVAKVAAKRAPAKTSAGQAGAGQEGAGHVLERAGDRAGRHVHDGRGPRQGASEDGHSKEGAGKKDGRQEGPGGQEDGREEGRGHGRPRPRAADGQARPPRRRPAAKKPAAKKTAAKHVGETAGRQDDPAAADRFRPCQQAPAARTRKG